MDTERYIQFYATPNALPDLQDAGWCGTGWYYWDETEAHCSGPFETRETAATSFAAYCAWLDQVLRVMPAAPFEQFARWAEALATQDNAITSDPIFTVQQKRRQAGMDPDYAEHFMWVDSENPEHPIADDATDEEDRTTFARLEAWQYGDGDWPEDLGDEEMWTRTGYLDRWEFVQPFLTREAAEQFRKDQAHNLGETRVYVESAYSNPEWKLLRALINGFRQQT